MLVDLGPKSELRGLDVEKNKTLAAQGPVVRIGDHQILIATRVMANGKALKIDRRAQFAQARQQKQREQMRGQAPRQSREDADRVQ